MVHSRNKEVRHNEGAEKDRVQREMTLERKAEADD